MRFAIGVFAMSLFGLAISLSMVTSQTAPPIAAMTAR